MTQSAPAARNRAWTARTASGRSMSTFRRPEGVVQVEPVGLEFGGEPAVEDEGVGEGAAPVRLPFTREARSGQDHRDDSANGRLRSS